MATMQATLHNLIAQVCPITGVSFARPRDKSGWRVQFAPEATVDQKAAAQAVIDGFDLTAYETTVAAKKVRDAALVAELEADSWMDKLRRATPAQLRAFIETNVTNLGTAREALVKEALVLGYLLKQDVTT